MPSWYAAVGTVSNDLGALGLAAALIIGEEEELVLEDGSTKVATKDIADEFAPGRLGRPLLS